MRKDRESRQPKGNAIDPRTVAPHQNADVQPKAPSLPSIPATYGSSSSAMSVNIVMMASSSSYCTRAASRVGKARREEEIVRGDDKDGQRMTKEDVTKNDQTLPARQLASGRDCKIPQSKCGGHNHQTTK